MQVQFCGIYFPSNCDNFHLKYYSRKTKIYFTCNVLNYALYARTIITILCKGIYRGLLLLVVISVSDHNRTPETANTNHPNPPQPTYVPQPTERTEMTLRELL